MTAARSARIVLPLAAAALLAGFPGCQSDKEHLRNALRPFQVQIEQEKAQLSATLRVSHRHNSADALTLDREVDTMAKTMDQIAHQSAPGSLHAAFVSYVQANAGMIAALHNFSQALRSGSSRALTAAGQRAQDAAGAVSRASDGLQAELR